MVNYEQYGFQTLVGPANMVFNGAEGWRFVALKVTDDSTGNLTIESDYDGNIGGRPNGTIELEPGQEDTLGSGENSVDGVTITAAAGCTVIVQAVKYIIINN